MLQKFTNQFVNITLIANEICARKSVAKQKKNSRIFFKACYKLFLPACLSVLSRNKMPQDILSSLQIHTLPTLNGTKGRLLAKDFRKKKQRIGKDYVHFFATDNIA